MLDMVFLPHLVFALGDGLKLLLWLGLCCLAY